MNTFDFHSFLFTTSYLMILDSSMLQMLKGSGSVSFRLNNTILPALYMLLNHEFDFPRSQTWIQLRFKFYNYDFVCSIKNLPYQAFRHRFLNFERHNKQYQEHFFKDSVGRAHCTTSCYICIEYDSIHFSRINLELSRFKPSYFDQDEDTSKFRPLTRTYEQDDQLFQTFTPAVLYHKCTTSCMLPIIKKQHLYSFSCQSTLIYAYYNNLTPSDKSLFVKYHRYHNNLFNDVLKILKDKLEHIYWYPYLRMITIFNLSIRELKMVKTNLLLFGLDLDIDFKSYPSLIDHKFFFLSDISFINKSRFSNSFLDKTYYNHTCHHHVFFVNDDCPIQLLYII